MRYVGKRTGPPQPDQLYLRRRHLPSGTTLRIDWSFPEIRSTITPSRSEQAVARLNAIHTRRSNAVRANARVSAFSGTSARVFRANTDCFPLLINEFCPTDRHRGKYSECAPTAPTAIQHAARPRPPREASPAASLPADRERGGYCPLLACSPRASNSPSVHLRNGLHPAPLANIEYNGIYG